MGSRQKALLAGAIVAGVASAYAVAEPTTTDLKAELDALQAQLDAQRGPSSADVDRVVNDVLKDANDRSKLLAVEGMTAGWDNGFRIASADGKYLLQPGLLGQFGYIANYRKGGKASDNDDLQDGFEIRRVQLIFTGNAITPDLTYRFMWNTTNSTGVPILRDAWLQYKFSDSMFVRLGQFRDFAWHEETTIDYKQLAVDRSVINGLIGGTNGDRVQGVMLGYSEGPLGAMIALHDGLNSKNTDFENSPTAPASAPGDTDFGVSGRAEYFVMGEKARKQYEDFTALGNKEDMLVIGGGFDWTQSGGNDAIYHTVDVQYENTGGLGLYAAYLGVDRRGASDGYDWGALVQASYLFNENMELFGRYSYTSLDDAPAGFEDNVHEFVVGINHYYKSHNAKVTVDVTYLPNGCPTNLGQLDILSSDDDEIVIRGQFQLLL